MPTKMYLTNIPSDVSGYLLATFGYPGPTASATSLGVVSVGTSASGTNIAIGLKWLTPPVKADVTVAGAVVMNFWGLESAAGANASLGVQLAEYTTSEQSAFCQTSYGTELTGSSTQIQRSRQPAAIGTVDGGAYTSTTIEAGNRIAILPIVTNVGTMGASESVTLKYNGATNGADGDSYVSLTETVRAGRAQVGSGTQPAVPNGPSAMAYGDYKRQLEPVLKAITAQATPNPEWLALSDELDYQGNATTATDVQSA